MDATFAGIALVALLGGIWVIRQQGKEVDQLRHDLEIEREWCEYWERRACENDDRLEALTMRHEQLQTLYAERTRELLAKNSWIVGAYGRARN